MPDAVTTERRNATSSWSGYLRQGKVGLLVALQKIMELTATNNELSNWGIEFEGAEDFDILCGTRVDSRHQVKANRDGNRKSAYKSALANFDIGRGCPRSNRFLHTIVKIEDWDSSSTPNPKSVELYSYPSGDKYCPLANIQNNEADDLVSQCIDVLKVIRPGEPDLFYMQIYEHLIYLLLEQVRVCHTQRPIGHPKLNFPSLHTEIIDCSADKVYDELENNRLKLSVAHIWLKYKEDLIGLGESDNINWDITDTVIDELFSLDSEQFIRFLTNIHPANENFTLRRNLNETGLKEVFIKTLISLDKEYDREYLGYRVNGESYLITTINDADNEAIVARDIVRNKNNAKELYEGNKIVTKHFSSDFNDLITATSIGAGGLKKSQDQESILDPGNMKFVKVDSAITEISGES